MMAGMLTPGLSLAPADSARAVSAVYATSLVLVAPMLLAAALGWLLRRQEAGRALLLRSTVIALVLVSVGRLLPLQTVGLAIPLMLATPLVALGRIEVAPASSGGATAAVTLAVYAAGLAFVLLATLLACVRWQRRVARSSTIVDPYWCSALANARTALGVSRSVTVLSSDLVAVPVTLGIFRSVIVVPTSALRWTAERRRIMLLHEMAHIAAHDWLFGLAARALCSVFWFHPGAWWLARRLREAAELAADERVLAAGVRRSDYAELLVNAADDLLPLAPALAQRAGLRARLVRILDTRRIIRPLAREWVVVAGLGVMAIVGPLTGVRLAPSRAVLTSLVGDTRWESRAWAVIGLASRADSVAVAEAVAQDDPNPTVRAWARYALSQRAGSALPVTLTIPR